jgi:predicted  nucleic acid-binding Zn-ribbon protein
MDYGLVNAFLAAQDLSENEQMLRQNLVSLNEAVQKLTQERATAAEQFQRKEQELLKFSGALENQLSMVSELARKKGLEPLVQNVSDEEPDTE